MEEEAIGGVGGKGAEDATNPSPKSTLSRDDDDDVKVPFSSSLLPRDAGLGFKILKMAGLSFPRACNSNLSLSLLEAEYKL